jgi:hypothetical protein
MASHGKRAAVPTAAEPTQSADLFEALPDDVLVMLLRLLPLDAQLRCGALSRRWARVLRATPELFTRLAFDGVTAKGAMDARALARLCARAASGAAGPATAGGASGSAAASLHTLDLSAHAKATSKVNPHALVKALRGTRCEALHCITSPRRLVFSVSSAQALQAACPTLRRGAFAVTADSRTLLGALTVLPGLQRELRLHRLTPPPEATNLLLALLDKLSREPCGVTLLDLHESRSAFGTGAAVERLLRSNTVLTSLNLRLAGHFATAAGGSIALFRGLRDNTALLELDLSYCPPLAAADVDALADALRANRTLKRLWLCCTPVEAHGAEALAAALEENSCLELLDLSSTKAGARGAAALARALAANTALRKLNLQSCYVGAAGAAALVDALQSGRNTTLHTLDLQKNALLVGDRAALRARCGPRVLL